MMVRMRSYCFNHGRDSQVVFDEVNSEQAFKRFINENRDVEIESMTRSAEYLKNIVTGEIRFIKDKIESQAILKGDTMGNEPKDLNDEEVKLKMLTNQEMGTRFTYHPPKGNQQDKYEHIRGRARELAEILNVSCPSSRELSIAFTKLEECVMWANAAIARRE